MFKMTRWSTLHLRNLLIQKKKKKNYSSCLWNSDFTGHLVFLFAQSGNPNHFTPLIPLPSHSNAKLQRLRCGLLNSRLRSQNQVFWSLVTGGTKKRSGIEGESTKQRGADRGLGANGCHDARRISIRPPLSPWTCFDCNGDSRGWKRLLSGLDTGLRPPVHTNLSTAGKGQLTNPTDTNRNWAINWVVKTEFSLSLFFLNVTLSIPCLAQYPHLRSPDFLPQLYSLCYSCTELSCP